VDPAEVLVDRDFQDLAVEAVDLVRLDPGVPQDHQEPVEKTAFGEKTDQVDPQDRQDQVDHKDREESTVYRVQQVNLAHLDLEVLTEDGDRQEERVQLERLEPLVLWDHRVREDLWEPPEISDRQELQDPPVVRVTMVTMEEMVYPDLED
jgi:hypothetical protein